MLDARPPFALDAPAFRFRAIATLAGRAPLGGPREIVIATYLAARLAHDSLPDRAPPPEARKKRADAARTWMSALAIPLAPRTALTELLAASTGTPGQMALCVRRVTAVTASYLDAGARLELERLADSLDGATSRSSATRA